MLNGHARQQACAVEARTALEPSLAHLPPHVTMRRDRHQ
jgi:hypothetical protein